MGCFLLGQCTHVLAGGLERKAILSGRFLHLCLMPMIGGGGSLELHGLPDLHPAGVKL